MNKIYSITINGAQILGALLIIYFLMDGEYMIAWNVGLTWAYIEIVVVILRRLREIAGRLNLD